MTPRPLIPNRRERILDAAEALVLDRGFDAMSIAAVAAIAEVGKGAVYLEFDTKRDILDALLRRGTTRMDAVASAALGESPRLSEVYRAAVRALVSDRLMTAAFLDDRGVLGTHVSTVTDGRYRDRHQGIIEWLHNLQQDGTLAPDVDPEHVALALSSATIGLLSAAKLLGPITPAQLEGAIEVLARMTKAFEPG